MPDIAKAFSISESACYRWIKGYSKGDTFTKRGYQWQVISDKKPQQLSAITIT